MRRSGIGMAPRIWPGWASSFQPDETMDICTVLYLYSYSFSVSLRLSFFFWRYAELHPACCKSTRTSYNGYRPPLIITSPTDNEYPAPGELPVPGVVPAQRIGAR